MARALPHTEKITGITYKVDLGTKTKQYRLFHLNCMRPWTFPVSAAFLVQEADEEHLGSGEKKPTQVMSELTIKSKRKTVRWTSKCERAFSELKETLTHTPVLVTP